jgi:ABC-type tungstate transport system permease subunit
MLTLKTLLCGLLLSCAFAVIAAPALADSSTTLTVVGTSDVSDSGLIPNVIQPAFETTYPQYSFNYIGKATGTAISYAETGDFGPSVLIVHAASLENQFVANGFSVEKYGRAIFRNDFVLAGPKSDPAGVSANAAHNIAQAFADVAAAGIAGHATFVSRGGTPGTTVAEHQIWGLLDSSHLAPSGLLLCAVSATNGGGETPIAAGKGITANGQTCPGSGALPVGPALPSWYAATGVTQGPNVQLANACTSFTSGPNSCYVFTDRGTYDYLLSGTDPAGSITNLMVVTSLNTGSAPGGANELINYFHAYEINPNKPGETVNTTAAEDFLNLLTSPSIQTAISRYLANTSDPEGAPFVPDASPIIDAVGFPRRVPEGRRVELSGTVDNAEIGYPNPADVSVTVDRIVGGIPIPVASGKTASTGAYSISFRPAAGGIYELSTAETSQIENSTLNPPFGDTLSPAATTPWRMTVTGPAPRFTKLSVNGDKVVAEGALAAAPIGTHGTIELLGWSGHSGRPRKLAHTAVRPGRRTFRLTASLRAGAKWHLELEFVQTDVTASHSGVREVALG